MSVVFGAIAPHGFPIIPALSEDAEGALQTRTSMENFGARMGAADVEVVVVATPHGVRVDGAISLANVARGAGTLFWEDRKVEQNLPVDQVLTDAVVQESTNREIPVALTGFAGNRRDQSVIPLDWGVITPMWFAGHDQDIPGSGHPLAETPVSDSGPPVVVVNPSRSMPREHLVEFGRATASAARMDGRRVAFVASCDWGHRHSEDGPYGYSEVSVDVDRQVVDAVKRGRLDDLLEISDEDAEEAAIDGLWQTLMLHGFLESSGLQGEFLSYEAPSYYGMLVAIWD